MNWSGEEEAQRLFVSVLGSSLRGRSLEKGFLGALMKGTSFPFLISELCLLLVTTGAGLQLDGEDLVSCPCSLQIADHEAGLLTNQSLAVGPGHPGILCNWMSQSKGTLPTPRDSNPEGCVW